MLRSYICKNKFCLLIDLCLSVIDFCLENVSLMYISDGDPKGEKRQHSSFYFSKSSEAPQKGLFDGGDIDKILIYATGDLVKIF